MKFILFLCLFCLFLSAPVSAQTAASSLNGRWYFTFDLPDSVYRTVFAFEVGEAGTIKIANLSEPNVYLTEGVLQGNELKLKGKSAFGDVTINSQFAGAKVSGKWSVGFISGAVSGEREPVGKASSKYLSVFEQTLKTLDNNFYDPKFNGNDLKIIGEKYRPQIAKAANDIEFATLMRTMLKELKVSHLGFYYSPFENSLTLKKTPVPNAPILQSVVTKKLSPDTAYMQIKQFTESEQAIAEIDQAFAEIGETPNLIVDLRGNTGGTLSMAMRIGDYLFPKMTYVGFFADRKGLRKYKIDSMEALKPDKLSVYTGYKLSEFMTQLNRDGAVMISSGGRAKTYPGKIAFLIDEKCASTTEGFLAVAKELKLGTLIGRRTRGAVLTAVAEKVDGDWILKYPKADYRMPQGKRIEGIGIEPYVAAEKGKELEKALEILKNQ